MVLFLTSSPTGPLDGKLQVNGLDDRNEFVIQLRKYWKNQARCLMIAATPNAYEQNDEMIDFFGRVHKERGFSWSVFDLWDGRTEDFSEQTLQSYDVILLGGGHVPTQNEFFKKILLREKIRNFRGVVIGISAGTMNCADVVYAQPELPGEAVSIDYQRFLTGLGLTKTMILPHYQMVKDYMIDGRRLYEEVTFEDSFGHSFLVLPDGSYLLSVEREEHVFGEAYVIADGKMNLYRDFDSML